VVIKEMLGLWGVVGYAGVIGQSDSSRGGLMKNRYAGDCAYCGEFVHKGDGFYEMGRTVCSETVYVNDSLTLKAVLCCERTSVKWQAHFNSDSYKAQVLAEQEAARKRQMEFRERQKSEKKDLRDAGKCDRCGGVGRADIWVATGSVCFKCNGTGKAK